MSWTFNSQTPAELKVASASLAIRSQGADILTLSFSRPCDEPPIAAGTWVELNWNGGTVFAGEAILPGGTGEGQRDTSDLIIRGPWADLEGLIYRTGTGDEMTVRLRFPADAESTEAVYLQDCVADVLAHAIGRGARMSIGVIDLGGQIPSQEFDGLPCSQILTSLLRFSPGAAVWFDYSGGDPVINIEAADGLPALAIAGPGCKGLRVDQRTDFQIPGTQLLFRKKIVSNYGDAEGVSIDSSGSVNEIRSLIMALDLGPAQVQYALSANRVEVGNVSPSSVPWWQNFIQDYTVAAVISHSSTGDVALTHYITAGSIASWMVSHIDGVANPDDHGCSGPLEESPGVAPLPAEAFVLTEPATHIDNELEFKIGRRKFSALLNMGSVEAPAYKIYSVEMQCTNCPVSGTYYRETVSSWDAGEEVPAGLAAAFQASCARLAYSGRFIVKQAECSPDVHRPGQGLNITGTAAAAWSSMRSPIQAVDHDLILGESTLTFGPASRLGPADLLELTRASLARTVPDRADPDAEDELEPINYQAVIATANESPSSPDEETGTLTVEIDGLPVGLVGNWSAGGGVGGSGPGSVEVPPGDYTVIFAPVLDAASGTLYQADSDSATITDGGTDTATGTYVAVPIGGGLHPWKVTLVNFGSAEAPDYQATVFDGSNLYSGLGNWSTETVEGLGEEIAVSEGLYIYLTAEYSSGNLDSCAVESGGTLPGRIVITEGADPEQTSWTTRIARIVSDGASGLKVEQNLFQHLTILRECVGGLPVEYPFPVS